MCEVGFVWVFFFLHTWWQLLLSWVAFLCVQVCLYVWVGAGTWAWTMWFIPGFFFSKPQSIHSALTLVLMRRQGLTYIHHLYCYENPCKILTNTKTRLPALPPTLPPEPKYPLWSGNDFLQRVWWYREVEQWALWLVSKAQITSACARSVLARRGLSNQHVESLAMGQPSSGF